LEFIPVLESDVMITIQQTQAPVIFEDARKLQIECEDTSVYLVHDLLHLEIGGWILWLA
jgi:hypothetical protein